MTPQEKAKELVQKIPLNGLLLKQGDAPKQYKEFAKECAMIIVDEIIATDLLIDEEDYVETTTYTPYWLDVKKEIQNL